MADDSETDKANSENKLSVLKYQVLFRCVKRHYYDKKYINCQFALCFYLLKQLVMCCFIRIAKRRNNKCINNTVDCGIEVQLDS